MKTIKIGRSSSNDCVIDNQTVSSKHALLTVGNDASYATLRDLNSTNGTFVNGKRITTETRVSHTDQIRFGSELTTLGEILGKSNKTIIQKPRMDATNAVAQKTIGKNSDNDIVLSYDDVSRRHAIIYKTHSGKVIIEDSGSTNGTYVNGIKVTSKELHLGDKVTITRNHQLDWEQIFKQGIGKKRKSINTVLIAGAVAAIIVLSVGLWMWINRPWDKERVYNKYHTAVCLAVVSYGYHVTVDGKDLTPLLCSLYKIEPSATVYIQDGELRAGYAQSQGTAFFITDDGKLATNLHVARPWLFSNDMEKLENLANEIVMLLATQDPAYVRSKIDVKAVIGGIYVIPDGLPISNDNFVECEEYRVSNNMEKDVAIIRTTSRMLPIQVKSIIDINDADLSGKATKEGKQIFTIGYPYGSALAINSDKELRNQVHDGSVTQDRGEWEFGHDAETASGASGSPIINEHGRLVGIHHAGMTGVTGAQGFNMGIKAKCILQLLGD